VLTRRDVLLTSLASLFSATALRLARAEPPSRDDPVGIVNAIYTRAVKAKGDGGTFIMENRAARAKYFSKSLNRLWDRADAHTQEGDIGPIEFDPVTNSQDPDVQSFKVAAEKLEFDKALVAVTLTGRDPRRTAADEVVRYEFARDGGKWKIDDIKGTIDGEPWSLRAILSDFLKT
jgi:hypothetical protein